MPAARTLALLGLTLALAGCQASAPARDDAPPPASLEALLTGLPPRQPLEWADLVAACTGPCEADLDRFEQALRLECPAAEGCDDPVARLPHVARTAEQRRLGLYPADLPQVAAVLAAWRAQPQPSRTSG
jgi:hypothetical protein